MLSGFFDVGARSVQKREELLPVWFHVRHGRTVSLNAVRGVSQARVQLLARVFTVTRGDAGSER